MANKTLLAAIAVVTLLSGCISPEERYARDVAQCESYGFSQAPPVTHTEADGSSSGTDTAGNNAFASCMMTLDQNRRAAVMAALRDTANDLQQQQLENQVRMLGIAAMAPRP